MTRYTTIKQATEQWVNGFNAIPQDLLMKAYGDDLGELYEVTPLKASDNVYIYPLNCAGEVVSVNYEDQTAIVAVDYNHDNTQEYSFDDICSEPESYLPMWSTMWTFGDQCDRNWLENGGLQLMAECGFRIYECDELGYVFGIDGCGYSFYNEHWIPLYEARGLKWHDESEEEQATA